MLVYLSAGGVIGDSNQAQSYMDTGQAIWVAAAVLALAPWLAVGILIAAIWAPNIWAIDTWRKTKRAKSARDSEGAA
jgi:hypothetical protein